MDSELLSGIIGASATLIVGLFSTPFIINYFIDRNKLKIYIKKPPRIGSLTGNWSGSTIQVQGIGGSSMESSLNVTFNNKGSLIKGITIVSWVENGENKSMKINFEGGFISENYIRILYQHIDTDIQNYGVNFLKLNASGNVLEGEITGFGHRSESIISGKTTISKN